MPDKITLEDILDSKDDGIYDITTNSAGPQGSLPLTEILELLCRCLGQHTKLEVPGVIAERDGCAVTCANPSLGA